MPLPRMSGKLQWVLAVVGGIILIVLFNMILQSTGHGDGLWPM